MAVVPERLSDDLMRFVAGFQIEGRLSIIPDNLFEPDVTFEILEGWLDKLHLTRVSFCHALTSFQAIACLSGLRQALAMT